MGLFKSKKKESNLDIPPPPPLEMNSTGPGDSINDMPPEMAPHDSIPMQDTLAGADDNAVDNTFPPLGDDSFPAPPEDFPSMDQSSEDNIPPPTSMPPEVMPHDDAPPPSFHEEHHEKSFHSSNSLFVEVSKYKGAMKELNNIKKSLKQSDNEIKELVQDMEAEEVTFQELHENLTNVEHKLLDLESSLFNQ